MSEREKQILETLAATLPEMSEFDKGYLLGMGEAKAGMKKEREDEKCTTLKKSF